MLSLSGITANSSINILLVSSKSFISNSTLFSALSCAFNSSLNTCFYIIWICSIQPLCRKSIQTILTSFSSTITRTSSLSSLYTKESTTFSSRASSSFRSCSLSRSRRFLCFSFRCLRFRCRLLGVTSLLFRSSLLFSSLLTLRSSRLCSLDSCKISLCSLLLFFVCSNRLIIASIKATTSFSSSLAS